MLVLRCQHHTSSWKRAIPQPQRRQAKGYGTSEKRRPEYVAEKLPPLVIRMCCMVSEPFPPNSSIPLCERQGILGVRDSMIDPLSQRPPNLTELRPGSKPEIVVSGRPDEDILRDYLRAIRERNEAAMPWVFSRGESLVYLRRDADLRAWFDEVDLDAMLYIAEHSATTYTLRRDEEKGR